MGNHADLHELLLGQADDFLQFIVDFVILAAEIPAIRHGQRNGFIDRDIPALATLAFAQMGRGAVDGIDFLSAAVSFTEGQLHKWCDIPADKLALQVVAGFFVGIGAVFAIKGVDQGIKNRGLACTGISGNEKKTLHGTGKVNAGSLPVGTKGLQGKFYGFHACFSFSFDCCMSLMISVSSCSSSGSISSKKFLQRSKGERIS